MRFRRAHSARRWVLLLGLAGCVVVSRSPSRLAVQRAEQVITRTALEAPIRFLADDALEGRAPGTRGDRLARLYLASMIEAIGLEPGAPDGGFEQPVELIGITSRAPRGWRFSGKRGALTLAQHDDFIVVAGKHEKSVQLDAADLVFVGYGIQAPEFAWDDFKGADLAGKVLVLLNDDPDWDAQLFAGKRRLYYGRWTYKYESADRQGAAGAILIHTDASAAYPWQTVQTSWSGESSRLPGKDDPALEVQAWVTEDAARRLFALGGHDLAELVQAARRRDFAPVPLGVRTSLRVPTERRRYATANLIGVLRGSDPKLRSEYVVYSAHYDHLGAARATDGSRVIYNGALDNAAGVAKLLVVARAFAALPEPPRRSLLFLLVAAEEQGLLGSEHFARHPTVPPGRMAAMINFDGANIWGATHDVTLVGPGKSTLDAIVVEQAARQGRTLEDEPFPERGSFYRSDQFNFARIGVPALFLQSGTRFVGRPEGWGRDMLNTWTAKHYHQPSDDYDPESWDFSGMIEDARLAFAVGLALAEADAPPTWLPGDEFADERAAALEALE